MFTEYVINKDWTKIVFEPLTLTSI